MTSLKSRVLSFFSVTCVLASLLLASASHAKPTSDDEYDRLDGVGKSGKRVDVIEWEGNLEIHVYPKGSLKGLALKLDKKDKNRAVMVIGYRFHGSSEQLIRRAILGVPFNEGFKAFKDPSADEYDKIIISNNGLSGQVAEFKLDPPPTQLYPAGHPANQSPSLAQESKVDVPVRTPASNSQAPARPAGGADENGAIKHFSF